GSTSGGPPRTRIVLARAEYAVGKLKQAQAALDSALKDTPDDATALVYRALVRAQQGGVDLAVRDLERLARGEPSTLPQYALGKLALERGDLDRAQKYLEAATTGNSETYRAALLLARIHERRGRPGDAIRVLEKAVADNPAFVPAQAQLALLHAQVG